MMISTVIGPTVGAALSIGISKHIQNNLNNAINERKENIMKTNNTNAIVTEGPKKSTDKRFEIDAIGTKITKLEIELMSLKKPTRSDWISNNQSTMYVPECCEQIFIFDGYVCYLTETGDIIGGHDESISMYCLINNIPYPLDMEPIKSDVLPVTILIRENYQNDFCKEIKYDEIGNTFKVLSFKDERVFLDMNNEVYGAESKTALIRYNIAKSDLKSGVDISDMATTCIQEIHSDPIIRIINKVYPFEYEKHKAEYENRVKELTAEIKALTDKKLVEITNLHELLNEEQKE